MPKKSEVDERIDSIFAGFHPEEHFSKPGRIPSVNQSRPQMAVTGLARQNSVKAVSRWGLTILLGFGTVSLLSAFLIYSHFNAAASGTDPTTVTRSIPVQFQPTQPAQNPAGPDTEPPTVPSGLTANMVNSGTVNLTWTGSTDNTGVVGYTIYRDGASIATASSSDRTFSDTTAAPNNDYYYALDAYDQAGNHSAVTASILVSTPGQVGSLIFLMPVADTYVNSDDPASNYGNANTLRVDASPDVHSYLRFKVPALGGKTISRARLKIYANSLAAQGIIVVAVADNTWSELTTNFNNAPSMGESLASSPPATDNATWISLDITSYIKGEGTYNFGLETGSATSINLASREAGAKAPQLVIELR